MADTPEIRFTVRRRGQNIYPDGIRAVTQTDPIPLTHPLREPLSTQLVLQLARSGSIRNSDLSNARIEDLFALDRIFHRRREGSSFVDWMFKRLQEIGFVKSANGAYELDTFGQSVMEASKLSRRQISTINDLVVLRVTSNLISNLSEFLRGIGQESVIRYVGRGRRYFPDLDAFEVELESPLRSAYLIAVEKPRAIPEYKSPNHPASISSLIFGECFSVLSRVRFGIVNRLASEAQSASGLQIKDPFGLAERGPNDLRRFLEAILVLHRYAGFSFLSLPDHLLTDLVLYFLAKEGRTRSGLDDFIKVLRHDFSLLIHPMDIIEYLETSVEYADFGIHLEVAGARLRFSFDRFIERVLNLGLGRVRPDGYVVIEHS